MIFANNNCFIQEEEGTLQQMEHYTKVSSHASESEEKKEPCDIHVKSGSKIRNIIAQSFRLLQNKKGEKIVLIGSGPTVTKAITCAEIIKRKTKGLHQLNKLSYTKIQDTWEPKEESLDKLQVTRKIPSISITLSKVPLDASQPGYQAPGKSKSPVQFGDEDWDLAWEENQEESTNTSQKTQSKKNMTPKTKRTVHKGKAETKTKNAETSNTVVNSSRDSNSEKGTNKKDQNRGSEKEPLERGVTESNKMEETHLAIDVLQSEQNHRRQVHGDVFLCEKSLEGHLEGGTLEGKQKSNGHSEFNVKQYGMEEQESQEPEAAVSLKSKQSCEGNVECGASQSRLAQSSQETETHQTKNTEKRLGNKGNDIPKSSPRKRQKAEVTS